jgi:26S proteasome regulatory subunit N5
LQIQAITSMVQECMTFLDATPDLDTKVALIKALITVSAGKVRACVVYTERARLLCTVRDC